MAILRVRDENGMVHAVRALQGQKGEAGAGVHIGSYVGRGGYPGARYIDLRSSHVRAVLLMAEDPAVLPLTLVTAGGVTVNGNHVAWLTDAYIDGTMDIGVMYEANLEGVAYHYIAFVEEAES